MFAVSNPTSPYAGFITNRDKSWASFYSAQPRALGTVIRDRNIYRDALLKGLGVTEMNRSKARAEVQLLVDEVWRTLT